MGWLGAIRRFLNPPRVDDYIQVPEVWPTPEEEKRSLDVRLEWLKRQAGYQRMRRDQHRYRPPDRR